MTHHPGHAGSACKVGAGSGQVFSDVSIGL